MEHTIEIMFSKTTIISSESQNMSELKNESAHLTKSIDTKMIRGEQLKFASFIPQAKPVLKWAGGKQQLLNVLLPKFPKKYNRYIEPFFGGGALFFAHKPKNAIIADSNPELINLYETIKDNVESLINELKDLPPNEKTFYKIRGIDIDALSPIQQAARTIYLNRTCYNGLYRVNRKGEFNVPYGNYKNPTICDASNLRAASYVLQGVDIIQGDYKKVLYQNAMPGDFIYLDPPYLPISCYSDFKRYTKEQFYEEDQIELAEEVHKLHDLGCYVLLTNSNHSLIHELYKNYKIEIFQTRRNINKDASKRTGEDVVITITPKRRLISIPISVKLPIQAGRYPSTRFMGSKQNLVQHIWGAASQFKFNSVLDLFSGSGVVSYMFKAHGKQVFSNDYMAFSTCFATALIENKQTILQDADIHLLCDMSTPKDNFVSKTFKGLYFGDNDNAFIDTVRANLPRLRNKMKRAVAMAALVRACMKKRPRGIFTYTGHRYDDGRRDIRLSIEEHFSLAVKLINGAVFDNKMNNKSFNCDAMDLRQGADLIYIDPPYFSPLSDNEYVRRYHFVEGLARNWQGVDMQWHTKTKKFKSYPTPFASRVGAFEAFDRLFKRFKDSIFIVSYSSNSLPTQDEMIRLLAKYKRHVEVIAIKHTYYFGNHNHKINNNNNKVKEYLFVGYDDF